MAAEIDSFIMKFRDLSLSGKKATLVINSNNGKAEVSVQLDPVIHQPPDVHVHRRHNGPSRQRRRQRRKEAREAAAKASQDVVTVPTTIAEKAVTNHNEQIETLRVLF